MENMHTVYLYCSAFAKKELVPFNFQLINKQQELCKNIFISIKPVSDKMKHLVVKVCLVLILMVLFFCQSWRTISKYRAKKTNFQVLCKYYKYSHSDLTWTGIC